MKDTLGDRIKDQYEDRTRYLLPRRTYTVIRVDGKAFHTLTCGFDRPYDRDLMGIMDKVTIAMCEQIQGAVLAYTQSDEISILLTDFTTDQTCAWFDGNVQKMASIAAAIATAEFNELLADRVFDTGGCVPDKWLRNEYGQPKKAYFDARVFTIPDPTEVENYFIWRQQDATRNSLQMAARAVYSHKELEGKGSDALHDLLHAKGINWNNYTSGEKRGRCIVKEQYQAPNVNPKAIDYATIGGTHTRTRWVALDGTEVATDVVFAPIKNETPIFTQNRGFLNQRIPKIKPLADDSA